jgi:putative RecB family exonuclease
MVPVPLESPRTLSPSKVAAFTDCALAFRFSVIDRLPEPPSPWATKGTLVHAALERLLVLDPGDRTVDAAFGALDDAFSVVRLDPEYVELHLGPDEEAAFLDDARRLVRNYFRLEDPTLVQPIGIELMLDATIGGARVRGIIDRLELDHDGELVVTDYKTGRAPSERYERGRLDGVQLYSLLCERNFGRRPARVRLLYLGDPIEISTSPSDQSTNAAERKVGAIWTAVERACTRDDFRPRPSKLCDYCAFRMYCPSFGGDPEEATRVAAAAHQASTLPDLAQVALAD